AAVLAAGGRAQERRLEARDLAVAARAGALHISPALAADAVGAVRSGDVLRIAGREGGWTRVETDDGVEGWLPEGGLLSLARD
ncbi:MAG TPA: SH3 domain-containing protein, partial [Gemmatimonadaceae bacterium]|nr:SH3 domain-containing protein [Gemmatimonadaceae bacterium]